ncbi:hypothetical protein SteCoe_32257 [Stentor coeruleus]|uniref:Uncharacterized protein n=1 Tax=Stentor coeruleus TaxID=5963 RepID=A0A1R2AZG6_9CILI|nr:hypothetical protein SteCoe_32257 [Stentor coeruleus]
MLDSPVFSRNFQICSFSWSLIILGVLIFSLVRNSLLVWNCMILIQQILTWMLFGFYFYLKYSKKDQPDSLKRLKYIFLTICGPYLLAASLTGFVKKQKMHEDLYALTFITWWVMFSVSIYCFFKLTLDIALYYHKKKKAQHYEMMEAPSSPLLK